MSEPILVTMDIRWVFGFFMGCGAMLVVVGLARLISLFIKHK